MKKIILTGLFIGLCFSVRADVTQKLRTDVLRLKATYLSSSDNRLEQWLAWVGPYAPPQSVSSEVNQFHEAFMNLSTLFVHLHPYEQEVAHRMVEIFKNYLKEFRLARLWIRELENYYSYFVSHTTEGKLRYFESIPPSVWKEAEKDPLVLLKILKNMALTEALRSFDDYWRALLAQQGTPEFPSWDLFQFESADIRQWFREAHIPELEPLLVWKGRFDEKERERLTLHKQELLRGESTWDLIERRADLRMDVLLELLVDQTPMTVVSDDIMQDPVQFMQRVFPYPIVESNYNEPEGMLYIQILLDTGNKFDLTFSVLPDSREGEVVIYFTLDIPTVSASALFLDQWEIKVDMRSHIKFRELTEIRIESTTIVKFDAVWDKMNVDKVRSRLTRELPGKLSQYKAHLEDL